MKKPFSLLIIATGTLLMAFVSGQPVPQAPQHATAPDFPSYTVNAFKLGEQIVYRVHYGAITAGDVVFRVDDQLHPYGNRKTYRFTVSAESASSFEFIYKYKAWFDTYVDEKALFPWHYSRSTNEGSYHYEDNVVFDHYNRQVKGRKGSFAIQPNTQDMISVFYYARCLNFDRLTPGKIYKMPQTFLDDKMHAGAFRYYGKEVIKTPLGKIETYKVAPVLDDGSVFHGEEEMKIWISADANKIPVRITSPIVVGSIVVDLKSYENLNNPFTALQG